MFSNIYSALYSHCCQMNSVMLELVKYRENWATEFHEMMRFLVTEDWQQMFNFRPLELRE